MEEGGVKGEGEEAIVLGGFDDVGRGRTDSDKDSAGEAVICLAGRRFYTRRIVRRGMERLGDRYHVALTCPDLAALYCHPKSGFHLRAHEGGGSSRL